MSRRKPFNKDAGYVASRRTPFGYVVVYDRRRGGDWIDGATRWVAAAYDHKQLNLALLDCDTLKTARRTMQDAVQEFPDWINP